MPSSVARRKSSTFSLLYMRTSSPDRFTVQLSVRTPICLFLSSLFSDKRAIFGLMVAAVIISALAYENRGPIRMYIKAKWDPGHRNPR